MFIISNTIFQINNKGNQMIETISKHKQIY